MSKSTKGVMKSLGENLIGRKGGKGSSSNKDKGVAPSPASGVQAKKKDLRTEEKMASREVQAMEVDDSAPSPPRVHGRGKSLKTLKESIRPAEKVKMMIDGAEVGNN